MSIFQKIKRFLWLQKEGAVIGLVIGLAIAFLPGLIVSTCTPEQGYSNCGAFGVLSMIQIALSTPLAFVFAGLGITTVATQAFIIKSWTVIVFMIIGALIDMLWKRSK